MRTALLAMVLVFSSACRGHETAAFSRPACGGNDWRGMQDTLSAHCVSHAEGPVAADTCQRLGAGFAGCSLDIRPATSVDPEWAYGWAAATELGGGAWTGAVFHSYEGHWLVAGFVGHDPQAVAPACSSSEWQEMQRAAAEACRHGSSDPMQPETCVALQNDFTRCDVDFRDSPGMCSQWGAGLFAMAHLSGPVWGGAMFQRSAGRWVVVGFRSGETR